ncbi:unnamed protein product [Prunus armeniaca]
MRSKCLELQQDLFLKAYMSGSKVLLTYKRTRQSRTDPVWGHECHDSLFVAPDDTSLNKPPDLQVHLIDKRSSEHYNRNSAVRF